MPQNVGSKGSAESCFLLPLRGIDTTRQRRTISWCSRRLHPRNRDCNMTNFSDATKQHSFAVN